METGDIVGLPGGWFLDTATKIKFRLDEDGNPVDEHGKIIERQADTEA